VFDRYDIDEPAMRHYLDISRTPEGFRKYLEETASHDRRALGVAA
jgi:glutaconate CoA-transferase subunit A